MFQELKDNMKNSYSPYSNYKVSACLVTKDGKKYFGVNIENASYGATVCAERVAIFKAISEGESKNNFKELNILGSNEKAIPCFICRQVFEEFFTNDVIINIYDQDGSVTSYTKQELCPVPFSLGE